MSEKHSSTMDITKCPSVVTPTNTLMAHRADLVDETTLELISGTASKKVVEIANDLPPVCKYALTRNAFRDDETTISLDTFVERVQDLLLSYQSDRQAIQDLCSKFAIAKQVCMCAIAVAVKNHAIKEKWIICENNQVSRGNLRQK